MPPDYHMHTRLCRHAAGEPVDYAAAAERKGMTEIGFSDHSPMVRDDFDNWRMYASQLDEYVEMVRKAQRDFPNLQIKLALEVDYLPGHEEWIKELWNRHKWDYFIGSVHYVSEWDIDNPAKLSEWKARDPFEVWRIYFDLLGRAAETRLFHIIGHADLPKKFCFVPKQDCTPMFQKFLAAAKNADVAIELNTAGLRKDCREIYPHRNIVSMAAEQGVPITFGSDAHAAEEVGMDFTQAIELARSCGYGQCARFTAGKREFISF